MRCSILELETENAKLHEQVQELSVQLATQPYRTTTQLQPQGQWKSWATKSYVHVSMVIFSKHISFCCLFLLISSAYLIFSAYFLIQFLGHVWFSLCIVGMQVEEQPTIQQEQMAHKEQPKQKTKVNGNWKILNQINLHIEISSVTSEKFHFY